MYIEVPIALIFFCFTMDEAITTNFVMYRSCYVLLGYNQSDCALLGGSNSTAETIALEEQVQPTATVILMTNRIVSNIIPILCSFIVGPWSTKHGRKPILLSSFTGYFVMYILITIICTLEWTSPWLLLIASIALTLGGGSCAMLTMSFCYVSDISSESDRDTRMGIFEAVLCLGALIGTVSSSYLFSSTGYIGIYGICAIISLLAVIYIYFFLPESIRDVENEVRFILFISLVIYLGCAFYIVMKFKCESMEKKLKALKLGFIRDLFDISVVLKTFKTCFKPRQNKDRAILCLLILILAIFVFVVFSDSSVFYLYVREKFHWSLRKYTLYSSANSVLGICGILFALYVLNKFLKIKDLVIITFIALMYVASSVTTGLATKDWHIYLASVIKCLGGVMGPLTRSAISKIIPPEELGNVFSLTTSLEWLAQLASSPFYTFIYNKTLPIYPNTYNFVSALLHGANVFVAGTVLVLQKLYPILDTAYVIHTGDI